jgi:hypothetical protein
MQGLFITDIDSFVGMQAKNIMVLGPEELGDRSLRNSILRNKQQLFTSPDSRRISAIHDIVLRPTANGLF